MTKITNWNPSKSHWLVDIDLVSNLEDVAAQINDGQNTRRLTESCGT
jgi:hypothetical protein